MVRPVSIKFHWNGLTKSLWINPGMDNGELRRTLCASFGLPDNSIQGVFVSDTGRSFGLDRICSSPSSFGGYTGIHVVLEDDDEDRDEDSWASAPDFQDVFSFDSTDISRIMSTFKRVAPSGSLDSVTFSRCFTQFLKESYKGNKKHTARVLEKLFGLFDSDGNGIVDSREFLAGLTVLCAGNCDEKVENAFRMFDKNNDNCITIDEMTTYLTSVFKVIQQTSSEVFDLHGVSAEELAEITAEQCFEDADLNRDGKLSFEEFKLWYTQPSQQQRFGAIVDHQGAVQVSQTALGELSKTLGFENLSAEEVFSAFSACAYDGHLDRERFKHAYATLMQRNGISVNRARVSRMLDNLFDIFDQDGNELVDFEELGSGLSVLCKGTRDDKVRAAFQLYDINNSGYITLDEMVTYMTSVFTLLYETSPEVGESVGSVDPAELAELTARQCFDQADTDGDGRLSFEEFRAWYSQPTSGVREIGPPPSYTTFASHDIDIDDIRRITGIGQFGIFQVFQEFSALASDEQFITWPAFQQAFDNIRAQSGVENTYQYQDAGLYKVIVSRLFKLFDTDGNNLVDFAELASGLGVLCQAFTAPDEKVRATFALFDINGDGFISFQEMERYLRSVFRVVYDMYPHSADESGLTPEQLATETTREAFEEADLNNDGRLSFAEFSNWYLNAEDGGDLAALHDVSSPHAVNIEGMRQITGLAHVELEDAYELFSEALDRGTSSLSREAFLRVFTDIAPISASTNPQFVGVVNRLFDIFDSDRNGSVDFGELLSGLSILCAGSENDKVETAFQLYDLDGNGSISFYEMQLYLTSVFKIVYEADPSTRARADGLSPEDLATVTAQSVFAEADINQDGQLSFAEFKQWYLTPASVQSPAANVGIQDFAEQPANWISLAEVRRLTCLDRYSPEEAFEMLAQVANGDGELDKEAFFRAFHRMVSIQGGLDEEADRDRLRLILHRLFDTFDMDSNGFVDYAELSSGLSILCGGDKDAKAEAAFQLLDVSGDNLIDFEEMVRYLTCVFKVMYETQPGTRDLTGGLAPSELAVSTAKKVFEDADWNRDGKLSFEEFKAWYSEGSGRQLTVAANLMAEDSDWFNLEEIRRLTQIHKYDSEELFKIFAEAAQEESGGKKQGRMKRRSTSGMFITRDSFDEVFQELIDGDACKTEDDFVRLTFILDRIYDMFDMNRDGKVDFSELSSGLSVLCGGEKDEKIASSFALFDENGDGFVTLQEMTNYLTSVYKVLYETQPEVRTRMGGISPIDLAKITAEEAFVAADLNEDGQLSLQEFQKWYNKPSGRALHTIVQHTPAFVSLDEIRQLTKIDRYAAEDIRDQIQCFADGNGRLDKKAFLSSFREIIAEAEGVAMLTTEEKNRLGVVLEKLFEIFDTDHNGFVDGQELNAGLSVLCGGDRDSKAEVAFEAFDYDGSGAISFQEMTRYLTAVFRMMYETQPGVQDQIGAPAEVLAQATAEQIFVDSELNENGELVFEEFKKWYDQEQGQAIGSLMNAVPQMVSLRDIRKLTRLDQYSPTDVFEAFARRTHNGELDRETFAQSFRDVAMSKGPRMSQTEVDRLELVIKRLFDAFDVDGSGVIEFTEMVSGLSVLCGGDKHIRAETAFQLYDLNGDGSISFEEMLHYLTSVFKVMFQLQPGTKERMGGASAELLADATAKQIFQEADINMDGQLSFEEFKAWYSKLPTGPGEIEKRPSFDMGTADSSGLQHTSFDEDDQPRMLLADARRLTGLQELEAADVFEEFAKYANENGELDEESFFKVFERIIRRHAGKLSEEDMQQAMIIVDQLFTLFDQDGNNSIDFIELASGLSVLCGGTSDSKAEAVFRLYDHAGTGTITQGAMQWYLTPVFRLMYETQPGTRERMGDIEPEELAEITTSQIFVEADLNHDNKLSFDEFKRWYTSPNGSSNAVNNVVERAHSWISVDEIRRITGLGSWRQQDVFEEFALAVDEAGSLGPVSFNQVFSKLIDESSLSPSDIQRIPLVLEKLFDIFDADGSGRIDFSELASGLSIFCNQSRDDKARAAFQLYDEDGDGYVSLQEMACYLASVYKVMYETNPGIQNEAGGLTPEELAQLTAEQIFIEADSNHDNRLSFGEFKAWYDDENVPPAHYSGNPADEVFIEANSNHGNRSGSPAQVYKAAPVGENDAAPEWLSLEEVKRITGFGNRDVNEVFQEFASFTNDEGVLNRSMFNEAFDALVSKTRRTAQDEEKLALIRSRLFDIFDVDGNQLVDFSEVASGLTVLCSGQRDDKTAAVFQLFDFNNDGFIQPSEMERYLTCVFKVMYETEPDSVRRTGGISPEELAKATSSHIFSYADLNHDGRLSYDEFKTWYTSSSDTIGGGIAKSIDTLNTRAIDSITIHEARRLTGLADLSTEEVFQEFAMVTNENGFLDRESFFSTFSDIIKRTRPELSRDDEAKLQLVLSKLFDVFDTDKNGSVDFAELASGLSILCSGDREDKVRSAFKLFDIDNDGYISMDEMRTYLLSVYKVLFELVPGTTEKVDVSPEELAEATTEQAFQDADINNDGKLSFEEFTAWFGSNGAGFMNGGSRDSPIQKNNVKQPSPVASVPMQGLAEIKRLTKLESLDVSEVLDSIRSITGERPLSFDKFVSVFEMLIEQGGGHTSYRDQDAASAVIRQLFQLFDQDGNGEVDFRELASGLSVLCLGSREDKVQQAFKLYDTNNDGYISLEEMATYLTSVFKVLYAAQPETASAMGVTAEQLGIITAEQCMIECDTDGDGALSFEEFADWYAKQ
mmetsp:Transcript_9937/g.18805  ORF Transcript_9937/g.18805 Transcript_9937/m.18805 type:complete len:2759 (+) Transcript_9937:118-8394(+)